VRIALLHPTYWPEVRRGSERLIHDLGKQLVSRGHHVTLLTSHRNWPSTGVEAGSHLVNAPNVAWRLRSGGFDVAHALFPIEGWAATHARDLLGGPPVVFSLHGIPTREFLVKRRYRLEMLERAIVAADAASALSEVAADSVELYFGRRPDVLPGGVVPSAFDVEGARLAERPTLVCAASLGDPRKRAALLFTAFERLRARRADARLLCVRTPDPVMSRSTPALPDGAEWVDGDRTEDLARIYAQAWASVLPANDEAFGLVLLESLAAGTPVVAARSGACPEVVTNALIGRLFDPDDEESLAAAMAEALELAGDPANAAVCKSRAAAFDWGRVTDLYEDVYDRVVGDSAR
jgi:glycosyltransferase involved in cell wall biosynthesis